MSTTTSSRPARGLRGGRGGAKDDGPRAKFSQLLPYLLEHKKVLGVVVVLSLLAAGASLAQPVLVQEVVKKVQAGDALGNLVWVLVALVVVSVVMLFFIKEVPLASTVPVMEGMEDDETDEDSAVTESAAGHADTTPAPARDTP